MQAERSRRSAPPSPQKVINYERPCSGKLSLPGMVFIRSADSPFGLLSMKFLFYISNHIFICYAHDCNNASLHYCKTHKSAYCTD